MTPVRPAATRSRPARLLVAVLVALGGIVAFAPNAPRAAAWSDGPCPTAAGVTVVIDFQDLGGGIWLRCAPGAVGSGLEALQQAGISWTPAVRFAGFVCRINDKPSAGGTPMSDGSTLRDPCITTSPAEAYWSYWTAPRGGNWCYSSLGGGNRTPPQGTVEGWSFSYKRTASTSPPPRMAPPAWVPGAPTQPNSTDCDSSTTAPTAPPNTTAPTAPPTTRPPFAGAGGSAATNPAPNRGAPAPTVPPTTVSPPTGSPDAVAPGSAAGSTGAPSDSPTAGGSTTVDPSGATTADTDGATPSTILGADGEEIALNADGSRATVPSPASSPVGVVVALAIIGALTLTSFVVRRRLADTA